MLKLLACCVTFLFTSAILARFGVGTGGGLLVMVGSGGMGGIAANAPMLERAAVIVAAVILAMAAFMGMLGIPGIPMGRLIGRFMGRGKGNDRG